MLEAVPLKGELFLYFLNFELIFFVIAAPEFKRYLVSIPKLPKLLSTSKNNILNTILEVLSVLNKTKRFTILDFLDSNYF